MKTYKSKLRKAYYTKTGKLKEYQMSLGVNTQINEDRFHQNENGKYVCDVIICFPDEYSDFLQEHENLQTENLSLTESNDAHEKTIKMLQDELSSIDEEHEKEIKKLKDEYSARIDALKEDLHEKDLEIERKKTESAREIGSLKTAHERHLKELKLFNPDIHMSIIDHQKEISDLKTKHQEELDDLKLFDEEKHMNISQHFKEISGIKDSISRQTILHNDHLNSLGNNLKFIPYLKGDYKSSLKLLKEDIEAFRYIAQYVESRENEFLPEVKLKEDDEDSS